MSHINNGLQVLQRLTLSPALLDSQSTCYSFIRVNSTASWKREKETSTVYANNFFLILSVSFVFAGHPGAQSGRRINHVVLHHRWAPLLFCFFRIV
jgi:hypothetical protein